MTAKLVDCFQLLSVLVLLSVIFLCFTVIFHFHSPDYIMYYFILLSFFLCTDAHLRKMPILRRHAVYIHTYIHYLKPSLKRVTSLVISLENGNLVRNANFYLIVLIFEHDLNQITNMTLIGRNFDSNWDRFCKSDAARQNRK